MKNQPTPTVDAALRPAPLTITCFGPPRVSLSGNPPPPDVLWRKHVGLLVYLALSPKRTRSREHLVGLLWPEKDQRHARRSLNEAIRRLKVSLGEQRFNTSDRHITLVSEGLHVDAYNIDAEVDIDVVRIPSDDFLEGWVVEDAPAFEDWLLQTRRVLANKRVELLLAAAETALSSSALSSAKGLAQRVIKIEPLSERAVRIMMTSAALGGDPAQALSDFNDFASRLREEIGEEPSTELTELGDRIRAGRWRSRARQAVIDTPPLVGRTDVHREAFNRLRANHSRTPEVVLVTGSPGMGCSRILNEFVSRARLGGAVTCVARPLESDHDARWSALRPLLKDLSAAPGLRGASPAHLSVLAFVEPEFWSPEITIEPRGDAHVAEALKACVEAAGEEGPIAIAVDDAQLADNSSVAVLRVLFDTETKAPLAGLFTMKPQSTNLPSELTALRADVGRRISGVSLQLDPLQVPDIEALVASMAHWCEGTDAQHRLARRIAHETNGRPHFIISLLRSLDEYSRLRNELVRWPLPEETYATPLPVMIPDVVRAATVLRVARLDGRTVDVLKAACLLGGHVDVDLIAHVLEVSASEFDDELDALEEAGFFVDDGTRLVLSTPLEATVIKEECYTANQRRRLLDRAADWLSESLDLSTRVNRARLLAEAGREEEAYEVALSAAHDALAERTVRTARRSLQLASRVVAVRDDPELLRLREALAAEVALQAHAVDTA